MASESLRVAFRTDAINDDLEVHDIDVAPGVELPPRILENPHVDFPGRWVLVGGDPSAYLYERDEEVADTSNTLAL
jgi:hypothetical protein